MYAGINLDQAPPIQVPLRFLLTAPWFGVLAGLMVFFFGETISMSRWQPESLALVHLLVLGFVSMVMFGALFQMLPVIAGVTVKNNNWLSLFVHTGLTLGSLFLALAFLFQYMIFYWFVLLLLVPSCVALIIGLGLSLRRIPQIHASARGMKLALMALFLTVLCAVLLLLIRMSLGSSFLYFSVLLSQLHQLWGLIGWITVLIVAVAFQVVPMFQMTPEYPGTYKKFLLPALFVFLISVTIYWLLIALDVVSRNGSNWIVLIPILVVFVSFSIQTLWLQINRKRRVRDAGFWFWRIGLFSLLLCALLLGLGFWLVNDVGAMSQNQWQMLLAILFVYGFVISIVNGMLYKIVPFLVWLHLQQRAMSAEPMYLGRIPDMKSIIVDEKIWPQFALHIAALTGLICWVFYSGGHWIAGLLVCISFGRLGVSLIGAYRRYQLELNLILKP